jgi:hypothetical protein
MHPERLDPDPLGVRAAAAFVARASEHVSIDPEALAAHCRELAARDLVKASEWEASLHFRGDDEQTLAYVFVLDTINFCFWGDPKWRREDGGQVLDGYWALAAALTAEAEANPAFLRPENLATLGDAALGRVLAGSPAIPLLSERAANLRDLGRWIAGRFAGRFAAVLDAAGHDAPSLVQLVVEGLASFRDEAVYKRRIVPFYKRAQILAGDVHGAFAGQGWGRLARLEILTAFADYKLPQILRHHGILCYSPALAAAVDGLVPVLPGSAEEVEIRANTIQAVEDMRRELQQLGQELTSYQVDWLLWLASQDSAQMRPYHRTRTIYY